MSTASIYILAPKYHLSLKKKPPGPFGGKINIKANAEKVQSALFKKLESIQDMLEVCLKNTEDTLKGLSMSEI